MPSPTTPAASLLKTVHEQPWNQAFGMDLYDGSVYNPNQPTIVAGSGGASIYYPKPTWQSGEGVPADGARDLPDVALFAADGENDSFYPICLPQEDRSEEHTSELQSRLHLVCRLLLEKKKTNLYICMLLGQTPLPDTDYKHTQY